MLLIFSFGNAMGNNAIINEVTQDKHFSKQKSKHFLQITYQTLSNSKKLNRPLRYLKDRFAILSWTLLNCPGAPPGARTLDPNIKSVVLYQLS